MAELITGRLLNAPFLSQVRSIQRTRADQPHRLVAWFKHWEKTPDGYRNQYERLEEEGKTLLLDLQGVYEKITEKHFNGVDIEAPQVTPMLEAFSMMEELTKCVVRKFANGLMVIGAGGIGKSYTVVDVLRAEQVQEGRDYIRIPGYSTPVGLYNTLYENNGKLVIFDDCDSIFRDLIGLNILKSVLDTMPDRLVTWKTSSTKVITSEFSFTGRIIFLSNMDPNASKDPNFRALMTRVLTLVIASSREEIYQRMTQIMPSVGQELNPSQQHEVLNFMRGHLNQFRDFSLRLLVNVVSLRRYSEANWHKLALALS